MDKNKKPISAQDQNNIFESENSVDIGSDHGFDNELTQQKNQRGFFQEHKGESSCGGYFNESYDTYFLSENGSF
ncbi:MAG: hypothetical protein LRY41_01555 [Candidatus Pacebacteria bacterium]|nr:hypothetical protein [Candidatus Paceibacterota bacterium]MCD8527998.1 hypothetical protein [Candidatus Paceibacterota bacterium]MCD8563918.1 hypothetical protein [Candidatus Paceibacterota bacterium]